MKFLSLILIFVVINKFKAQKDKIIDLNYNYDEKKIQCHFIDLTNSNFDYLVQNGITNHWLLIFYTENCGFCKQIKSLINKMIDDGKIISEIKFGKIDLSYNLGLQIRFNITKIPYIILVNNYSMYEVNFLPTEDSLNHFFESENLDEYKKFKKAFPQKLSLYKFIKNLVIFAFSDLTKKINSFLKKNKVSIELTTLTVFIVIMSIGVPIVIIIYIFLLGFLSSKCQKKSNVIEKKKKE
jgi:hypothetical protein